MSDTLTLGGQPVERTMTQPDLFNPTGPDSGQISPKAQESSRAGSFWQAMGLWMVGEGPDPR